jgi:hypothetical protein
MVERKVSVKNIRYRPFPLAHSSALIPIIPSKVVATLPHNENIPRA